MEGITKSLKISLENHKWLRDEQNRLEDREGKSPSQEEMFLRMRKAYLRTPAPVGVWPDIPGQYQKLFRLLADVVRGGDRDAISAVSQFLSYAAKRSKRD